MLVVLLEYIDLFNMSGNIKQTFGRGYPTLYYSVLLYFILSIVIVTNKAFLLDFAPIMPAFCSLLLPSDYSNNFARKIDASLDTVL